MKSQKIIVSCLISVLIITSASADWVPVTDEFSLSDLQGQTLPFGDKELSDITISGIIATGGAIAPDANSIKVQGGYNDLTGDYGLKFNLAWLATSNQIINATLTFKISVQEYCEDLYIKDVGLDITGASANGTGGVSIGESVRGLDDHLLGHLSCSVWPGSPLEDMKSYAEFEPVKAIWIHSKDISITGGTNGTAHISEFKQYYSQIPEPATIMLLGTAGLWALTRKNKSVRPT